MSNAPHFHAWRKSSYSSGADNCVEISTTRPGLVGVRDSKHPDGAVLVFHRSAWAGFVHGLQARDIARG